MVEVITDRSERPTSGWGVLVSPRRAFIGQRDKPSPLIVLLVIGVFALLPPLCFLARVDMHAFMTKQMRQSGQMSALEDLPEEKREEARAFIDEKIIPAMTVALPVGAVGQRYVWILLLAALSFGVLRGTNKEIRFKSLLGAIALASAPLAIHDVLGALVYLTREVYQYEPQNPVLSNPAAWMRGNIEKEALAAALHGLDLFTLWTVYLCGLALSVVSKRRGLLPWLLPAGGWLLLLLGKVAAAAASGAASKLAS